MERIAIQTIIKEKGFTQKEVALQAGIRPRRYACQIFCDMIAGRRRGYRWRPRIEAVLGVDHLFD